MFDFNSLKMELIPLKDVTGINPEILTTCCDHMVVSKNLEKISCNKYGPILDSISLNFFQKHYQTGCTFFKHDGFCCLRIK